MQNSFEYGIKVYLKGTRLDAKHCVHLSQDWDEESVSKKHSTSSKPPDSRTRWRIED